MLHHNRVHARASRRPESGETARTRRVRTTSIALAGVAGALLIGIPTVLVGVGSPAGAAVPAPVPTFPDNLNVFPNRDFVSIDGYSEHAGQPATVTVTRPGVGVIGAATGIVSGGDVAFEVNHPGGICWGASGGPNVTPDIQPHDVVSISFNGIAVGATTVQDVQAFDAVQSGTTLTVNGHIGPDVNEANIEQRIIEPGLVDTIVGKRDVRAVPGPLTLANKGGYSSSLVLDRAHESFVATYIFDDLESATIAANAGLGERAMAWEFTDPAANRQGMTIAENGEPGGPGMGGCPNGPLQSGPPGPTNVVAARVANGTGVKVNWTPAVTIPGTPAIEGYRVTAVAATSTNGEQVEIGKKIANPAAAGTTINGLFAGETYDIEVMSYSSTGYTFPAIHASAAVDSTPPVITASPAGGSYPVAQQVTLSSNEIGSDIYYTLDNSDPIANGQLNSAPEPLRYTGPITVDGNAVLKFAGFDPTGNVSATSTQSYTITNDPVPAAPAPGAASVGYQAVTLNWAAADAGAPGLVITNYKIDEFTSAASTTPVSTVTVGNVLTANITGLTGDAQYWFTISAQNNVNSAFGPASAKIGPLTPQGPVVAFAGNDQTNVTRNTVVTLSGAGSTSVANGATYAWTQLATGTSNPIGAADPNKVTITSPTAINASFSLPFLAFPKTNQPLTFQLAVTVGGTTMKDQVVITPHVDAVSITKATWKVGDFRVIGVGAPGSTVTARNATTGAPLGSATVIADGSFDLRNRATNIANPVNIYVDSNMGGTAGPFKVAT